MKPNDFSNRFELYELKEYILVKKKLPLLEEEFEEIEQSYYEDVPMMGTQFNYELGSIYPGSGCSSLEDFVINMIEKKERFLKVLDRFRKQEQLFDLAMDSLTPREKDVIQVYYFNRENNLGLSNDFFCETLIQAQDKLCSFIGGVRFKQRDEAKQEHKQQLKNVVSKWARGREVS